MQVSMTARLGLAIAGLLLAGSAWAQAPAGGMERGPGFGAHHPPFEKALGQPWTLVERSDDGGEAEAD